MVRNAMFVGKNRGGNLCEMRRRNVGQREDRKVLARKGARCFDAYITAHEQASGVQRPCVSPKACQRNVSSTSRRGDGGYKASSKHFCRRDDHDPPGREPEPGAHAAGPRADALAPLFADTGPPPSRVLLARRRQQLRRADIEEPRSAPRVGNRVSESEIRQHSSMHSHREDRALRHHAAEFTTMGHGADETRATLAIASRLAVSCKSQRSAAVVESRAGQYRKSGCCLRTSLLPSADTR
ncbi:hypothetical protein MRX96_050058 [Rhipicephalus microplus]